MADTHGGKRIESACTKSWAHHWSNPIQRHWPLSCGQVQSGLAPCLPYLQCRGPLGSCCGGVKGLLGAARTPVDRKTACTCLKSAANAITGTNIGKVAGLPSACGVNIPYKISPSTDCSRVQ
nr:non-specific lipid-transfer protein 2-like [Nicotiana tomentosiformis]